MPKNIIRASFWLALKKNVRQLFDLVQLLRRVRAAWIIERLRRRQAKDAGVSDKENLRFGRYFCFFLSLTAITGGMGLFVMAVKMTSLFKL
jgi:hypothetical protein